MQATGLDPTKALLNIARTQDPDGTYIEGTAEALPFADAQFDVCVFYLSLIDIPDLRAAIAEAARVLRPGGRILIANLHPHITARPQHLSPTDGSWAIVGGHSVVIMDELMRERAVRTCFDGLDIINYHRPLSAYMTALLDAGLILRSFTDPPYTGSDAGMAAKYGRMPWGFMMVWDKPERTP